MTAALWSELEATGRIRNLRDHLLVETLATAATRLEMLRGDLSRGKPVSDEELTRMANAVARLISSLNLKSTAPRHEPGLASLLEGRS